MITPRILQRKDHLISRRDIQGEALTVLYGLHEHGYQAYLAGGGVRDLMLGRTPKDFDVVTNATPNEVKRVFRNSRLIGRRFRLAHVYFGLTNIEVATFRALQNPDNPDDTQQPHFKTHDGLVVRDNVWGTPEEDALRRDFTINAVFYNIADFTLIDFVGGLDDLKANNIRFIGDPVTRCAEDPVRMIRAVRFAAMLGMTIEHATSEGIRGSAERLALADRSRLYEEIQKLFFCGSAQAAYGLMRYYGLLEVLLPDLGSWLGRKPCTARCRRVSDALKFLDLCKRDGRIVSPALLFALLLGGAVEAEAAADIHRGIHSGLAVYNAAMAHCKRLSERVQVPNLVRQRTAEILGCQLRLVADGGRRAEALAEQPFFAEALAYAEFSLHGKHGAEAIMVQLRKLAAAHLPTAGDGRPARARRPRRVSSSRRRGPRAESAHGALEDGVHEIQKSAVDEDQQQLPF
ncbi:MAG: polynucleotide adenylyltransferase PcnB [bacterium]